MTPAASRALRAATSLTTLIENEAKRRDARVLQRVEAVRSVWLGVREHQKVEGGPRHKLGDALRLQRGGVGKNGEAIVRVLKLLSRTRRGGRLLVRE